MRPVIQEADLDQIARGLLNNWEDWEAEAGQDAQREQHPDAHTDTMLGLIKEYLDEKLYQLTDR